MTAHVNNKDELYHYGVKGMHWGHRKQVESDESNQQHKKRISKFIKGGVAVAGVTALTVAAVKNKDKLANLGKNFFSKNKQEYASTPFSAITRPAIQKPAVKRPVGRPKGSKSYAKFNAWEWNTNRGYKYMMHQIYKK